ncbi:MAG TPA: hypothetical protein PLK94_12030 [Alphaproteobacteria bacterium]|nr:hypothetical protein [Alphaproteobacteria bacterium]HOO52008.1 hypothetical protein [Alphaproteobacteria bacterium]
MAKIIGVRVGSPSVGTGAGKTSRSTIYYPVFEYRDRHGKTIVAESLSGSSLLRNKIPGTKVKVKVDEESPEWVSPKSAIWIIIPLLMLGISIGMGIGLYSLHDITPVTVIVWVLIAIHFLWGRRKFLPPQNMHLNKFEFKLKKKAERDEKRKSLVMLNADEVALILKKEDRFQQIALPFVLIIACALLYGGHYLDRQQQDFIASAVSVEGTYEEMSGIERRVLYKSPKGKLIKKRDPLAKLFPSTRSAKTIRVYHSRSSAYNAVIDRGIWQGAEFKLMMGVGGLILFQSIMAAFRRRSRMSRM